jgi:hypothetical protein
MLAPMGDILKLVWWAVIGLFRSRASLEAEILTLRQQLNVLQRKAPKRVAFSTFDRLVFASLYWIAPGVVNALVIVKPETVIRWHRAGFRLFWRWKSRHRGGRPKVSLEIRRLIREISLANPLWGAPRIHGELLKLGIEIGQTSVAKYMARMRRPPSQGWKTFLRNHADGIVNRSLRRSDTLLSAALWLGDPMARPAPDLMAGRDRTPERRMDCSVIHRSLRLRMEPKLRCPRSRPGLWRDFYSAASCHGHSRPANRATLAMAEWTCGTADWLDPAGMS